MSRMIGLLTMRVSCAHSSPNAFPSCFGPPNLSSFGQIRTLHIILFHLLITVLTTGVRYKCVFNAQVGQNRRTLRPVASPVELPHS